MIPYTIKLKAGGAFLLSASCDGRVLVVGPEDAATLTRAEAEELADGLCLIAAAIPRATPITSASDPRVRGDTECSDGPLVRGNNTPSAPQG